MSDKYTRTFMLSIWPKGGPKPKGLEKITGQACEGNWPGTRDWLFAYTTPDYKLEEKIKLKKKDFNNGKVKLKFTLHNKLSQQWHYRWLNYKPIPGRPVDPNDIGQRLLLRRFDESGFDADLYGDFDNRSEGDLVTAMAFDVWLYSQDKELIIVNCDPQVEVEV